MCNYLCPHILILTYMCRLLYINCVLCVLHHFLCTMSLPVYDVLSSVFCSIIGLYVSLVLVVGRFVRVFFSGRSNTIMFEELPNVDSILHLCLNIYLVREYGDFYLEEQLFSKLLFVYRSTEVMIKYTKWKQD